jgi:hypothetical protein
MGSAGKEAGTPKLIRPVKDANGNRNRNRNGDSNSNGNS